MNRRTFLKSSSAAGLLLTGNLAFAQQTGRPLPILPLLEPGANGQETIDLELQNGTHDFGNGASNQTLGINSGNLGPLVKLRSGENWQFAVKNSIDESVALHWHGLHIPGNVDGGPHQEITPGDVWRPDLPVRQRASTNWFHAHTHGKTASQVYRGLAGVMIIEDDDSLAADLPNTHGVDDFTLVLQDKTFRPDGGLHYELTAAVFEDGFEGDTVIVNGAIAPVFQKVPKGLVRFRILNGANARFFNLSLSNNQPLRVIASDGGFLGATVETEMLKISPGERYEVLVDMRGVDNVALQVSFPEGEPEGLEILTRFFAGDPIFPAVNLIADASLPAFDASLPTALSNLDTPQPDEAVRTREFQLNMGAEQDLAALAAAWGNICGSGGMGINGQPMNMDRIDVEAKLGETERWRITADDMEHPFHVHGCSFRILQERGAEPPDYARGWKDMVAVQNGVSEILVRFDYPATEATPYMYHCHILEHEDCGMMGQFTVG